MLFREHAAKAGIDIDIERVSTDGYWTDVWNVKPFCVSFWNGRTTEDLMLTTAFYSGSAWNETHWKHDRFDTLLIQARAELEDARRREIYVELQRIIHDEGGLLCRCSPTTSWCTPTSCTCRRRSPRAMRWTVAAITSAGGSHDRLAPRNGSLAAMFHRNSSRGRRDTVLVGRTLRRDASTASRKQTKRRWRFVLG